MLRTAGVLLAAISTCMLLVLVLATSETGSRRLLRHVAAHAGIGIERISGALATGVKLGNVRYNNGPMEVRIGELDFDWRP
jgi:hypothetical protein